MTSKLGWACRVFSGKILAFSLPLLSLQAYAGAWVPEEGKGYVKLGVSDYEATDFFGTNNDFTEFSGNNYSLYAEHGLGNKLAIFGSLLYQDIEQTDGSLNTQSATGLGDLELGLRYQLTEGPNIFSVAYITKLPYLYDEDDTLPRGNGQVDHEFRLLYGRSLHPYGYIGVEAGYRLRNGNPSDEYRYLVEYGFSATKNLYFRTKLDGIESARNADSVTTGAGNLSVTPEFDLGKFELTVGWNFDKKSGSDSQWGLELTYNKDLYGTNALDGDGFQLGLTRVY